MRSAIIVNIFFLFCFVSVSKSETTAENMRLIKLYEAEEGRVQSDRHLLGILKLTSSRRLTREAILGAGRIGDAGAFDDLAHWITQKDLDYRKAAIFSLSI